MEKEAQSTQISYQELLKTESERLEWLKADVSTTLNIAEELTKINGQRKKLEEILDMRKEIEDWLLKIGNIIEMLPKEIQ